MTRRSYGSAIGFLDLLFNCLIVFVFMFVMAFAQIEPEENKAELKTKAEYIISVTWSPEDSNDVDVWILDPAKNLISFKEKERGLTHIDRDDVGHKNDFFTTPDGQQVRYDFNQEIVTIRGFIPGQWIVTLHLYKVNQTLKPSEVSVILEKINPKVTTVFKKRITLKKHWQEELFLRFTMNAAGDIISTDNTPISLTEKHPDMNRPVTGTVPNPQPHGGP